MRKKVSKTERLQKRQEKLTKLKAKKETLRNRRINLLEGMRAKNRTNFEWVAKDKAGNIRFKLRGGGVVQTNQRQIFVGESANDWEKYQKLGERENKTQENIWETQKKIRQDEKAVKKEQEKEDRDWENHYLKNVVSYVKKNGVNRHLIERSINVYLRTMGNAMMAKQERQGQVKGFRGSWLKYNRGRG